MLGMVGTSAYRCIADFASHKDYLHYMYGNVKGFVTRSVIPQERKGAYYESFNFADRLINRNRYYDIENVYTSMNTFLSKRKRGDNKSGRKVANLKRLNALYLDIDCYKIDMYPEQALFELEQEYFGRKIPVPTFAVNSGRGLYLIWKIDEDRNALPRWTSVQKYLFEQCKDLNADPQAIDAARILRVPFSVNGKNGEPVRIVHFFDVKYTLYELIQEYDIKAEVHKKNPEPTYPYGEATARQRRVAEWQATEFTLDLPDFSNYQETFNFIRKNSNTEHRVADDNIIIFARAKTIVTMLDGRVNDLFKLFSMRRGEDCRREYALFLCRLWVGERTNDYAYALEKTKALNRSFDAPLDEDYVVKRTKSAETKLKTGKTYQYSVSKLIRVLHITNEEQRELEYLSINPQGKADRKKKANRRAYLLRLEKEGKQTKGDTVRKRREEVARLIAEGKGKGDICAALEISARTYDRDRVYVVAEGLLCRAIEAVKTALDTALNTVTPFFQPTNYERNPFGVSACFVQLTLADFWGDSLPTPRLDE